MVARGHRGGVVELEAGAVDLGPPRGGAGLVVADDVGVEPEPVPAAVVLRLLEGARHRARERPLEADRQHVVGGQAEPHRVQWLQHLVADRSGRQALDVRSEPSAGAHGPLLLADADAGVGIEHAAVRVLAHPEGELHRPVLPRRHRAHLLRPRPIALRHGGERVGDLVVERLVGGDEGPERRHRAGTLMTTVARHAGSDLRGPSVGPDLRRPRRRSERPRPLRGDRRRARRPLGPRPRVRHRDLRVPAGRAAASRSSAWTRPPRRSTWPARKPGADRGDLAPG